MSVCILSKTSHVFGGFFTSKCNSLLLHSKLAQQKLPVFFQNSLKNVWYKGLIRPYSEVSFITETKGQIVLSDEKSVYKFLYVQVLITTRF